MNLIQNFSSVVNSYVRLKNRTLMSVEMLSKALKVVIEYDGYYYYSGGRSGRSFASHVTNNPEETQAFWNAC